MLTTRAYPGGILNITTNGRGVSVLYPSTRHPTCWNLPYLCLHDGTTWRLVVARNITLPVTGTGPVTLPVLTLSTEPVPWHTSGGMP